MNSIERLQARINYVYGLLMPCLPPQTIDQIRKRIIHEHGVFFWSWLIKREQARPKDPLDTILFR